MTSPAFTCHSPIMASSSMASSRCTAERSGSGHDSSSGYFQPPNASVPTRRVPGSMSHGHGRSNRSTIDQSQHTRLNPARSLPCTDAAAPPIRKSLMKYGVPGILGKGAEMGGQDSVNPPRAGSLGHREPEVTRTRSRRRLGRACSDKPDGRAEPARCRGASLPYT